MRRIVIIIVGKMLLTAAFLAAKPASEAQTPPTVTGDHTYRPIHRDRLLDSVAFHFG